MFEVARWPVLPVTNGALPHGAVPPMGEEPGQHEMRVVPSYGVDAGASEQELPALEAATEDPVGGGGREGGKGEEPIQGPELVRG